MRSVLFWCVFSVANVGCLRPAFGQAGAGDEIAALRAEISALTERLDRLERAAAAEPAAAAAPAAVAVAAPVTQVTASNESTLKFSGDFRYRHEAINEETRDERERQRIRARFGLTTDINESLRVGLTLSTGNDDPVSGNQTLGSGFDRKSFGVDRAYFAWRATKSLSITGGKMPNPFFRPGGHHLIYDSDLNPEGLALNYSGGSWFANYAGLWVEERSSDDDSILLGGQFGYRHTLDNDVRVTAGVSYYDYLNTKGRLPFWDGSAAGNRLDIDGNYLNDFNETEVFAEIGLHLGARPFTVFADYVVNGAASDANDGYAVGATYGAISGRGSWRFGYAYEKLGADAVIGTFTDSDFAGGGTDGSGHVLDFNYGIRDRWTFGFKYFLNQRGADAGNERSYNRLQADLMFSY